jgi:outer membrane lipoprotein carrier protein
MDWSFFMVRLWLPVLFFVFLFPLGLSAAEQSRVVLSEVVNALESPFKVRHGTLPAISDFKLKFVQESRVVSLGQKQMAHGEAVFQFLPASEKTRVSPLFRWEYRAPDEQLIVSDGRNIWFYLPENQQAIKSEARKALAKEEGNNPLIFLTNLGELSSYFEIRWYSNGQKEGGDHVLELIPLEKSPLIKTIILSVRKEALTAGKEQSVFPIRSLLLTNVNNDETRIEFLDALVNHGPSGTIFQFTPPEGTEILTPEEIRGAF